MVIHGYSDVILPCFVLCFPFSPFLINEIERTEPGVSQSEPEPDLLASASGRAEQSHCRDRYFRNGSSRICIHFVCFLSSGRKLHSEFPSLPKHKGEELGILQFEMQFDLLALVLREVETLELLPLDDSIIGRFRYVVALADVVALPIVDVDLDVSA